MPVNTSPGRHNAKSFSDVEYRFRQRAVDAGHFSLACSHGLVEHASRTRHFRLCKRETAHQNVLRSALSPHAVALDENEQAHMEAH
jgi:hypothetical protein